MDLCYVNLNVLKDLKYEKQEIVIRKHSSKIFVGFNTGRMHQIDHYHINGKAFSVMDAHIISLQADINDKELKFIKQIFT